MASGREANLDNADERPSILSLFDLKGAQQTAAERLDTHLAVTAGAGSGKTRALVGRYLNFVEHGVPLRALVAITFTEKAAREMRSRIRQEIERWLSSPSLSGEVPDGAQAGARGGGWQQAFIDLDSARIGTIHALCADLLRLYPAEAGVDPRFDVLEEGLAATLQAQVIETALAWAATDPDAARLFAAFKESDLRRILQSLISNRLDAARLFSQPDPLPRWETELARWLDERLAALRWVEALQTLSAYASPKADDKLEAARRAVLARWQEAQAARAANDWNAAFAALRELRGAVSTMGQQKNWDAAALEAVREAMRTLRDDYAETLAPMIPTGGCDWQLDRQVADLLPALHRLFERTLAGYQALKDSRRALDFDDLEDLATRLLTSLPPSHAKRERSAEGAQSKDAAEARPGLGLRAVLVDEFQDTNDRQRQIIYALTGFGEKGGENERANLFIVGDAKQGIYRFRGADVTVFRRIQSDVAQGGGEVIDLDLTFRAHAPLLDLTRRLIAPLMGEADDPARPYRIPFAPLTAYRPQPGEGVHAPFVEFRIGLGEDAEAGRRAAAAALAARLHELREQEKFKWEDMALLFRASTAFPVYEDALEAAGIPFVTVAGKGFYDRPEIRDLLNALAALADPADDLALAGLLRSPAFGLTDADLYRLRFPSGGDHPRPLYPSLREASNLSFAHVAEIISHLHALAGRLPVAELLKEFLDRTHYRAILKAVGGAQRLARNVDKLLADAHRSRLGAVGDFLEYVQSLRDVGAREGEAPAEVGGAVQLMTVHKAKGLEFPLVVIADAAYDHSGSGGAVHLDPALGVLLKIQTPRRGVSTEDARPCAWQLGALADADREDAEDLRLLYVAFTRAKEKVVVSGHAKISAAKTDPGRLLLSGWLKQLGEVIELNEVRLSGDTMEAPRDLRLSPAWADAVTVALHPSLPDQPMASRPETQPEPEPVSSPGPLATTTFAPSRPIALPVEAETETRADPPARVWRVVAAGHTPPAWVVGQLVHEALRCWLFPDRSDFDARLRPTALRAGLTGETLIRSALHEARRLLERFHAHSLFAEMDRATERYHEIPYTLNDDAGIIDVLYRSPVGWTVADFKTDDVRDEAQLRVVIREKRYDAQLKRYAGAVVTQLGAPPRALLVFLNAGGGVSAVTLEDEPG